ncbi:MAG: pantoate--beta-alanine ligase [Fibrobacteraceae bacterium]
MKVFKTISALRRTLYSLKREGKTIGLVPTMGALHEGHMSLVDASVKDCDVTVVSVFVNPIQFGKTEDLDKYPRRLKADAELAGSHGADFIFAPSVEEMYPNGDPLTLVRDETLESLYCGAYRPGHFRGVLTVVAKLFLITAANKTYFGQKDYQQAFLIQKMVKDLNFDVDIKISPIIRESSGLARSSRNEFLSEEDHRRAVCISAGLNAAKAAYAEGQRKVVPLRDMVVKAILVGGGLVQFVEVVSQKDLRAFASGVVDENEKSVILVAAYFGKTRLIDNIEL